MDTKKAAELMAELHEKQAVLDAKAAEFKKLDEARQTAFAAMQVAEQERDAVKRRLGSVLGYEKA